MRHTAAYMGSLRTTAILVAFALLVLVVLRGPLGFGHWPRSPAVPSVAPLALPALSPGLAVLPARAVLQRARLTRAPAPPVPGLRLFPAPASTAAGGAPAATSARQTVISQPADVTAPVPARGRRPSPPAASGAPHGGVAPAHPGPARSASSVVASAAGAASPAAGGAVESELSPVAAAVDGILAPAGAVSDEP